MGEPGDGDGHLIVQKVPQNAEPPKVKMGARSVRTLLKKKKSLLLARGYESEKVARVTRPNAYGAQVIFVDGPPPHNRSNAGRMAHQRFEIDQQTLRKSYYY